MLFESPPSFSEITAAEAHGDRGREDLEATVKRHLALLTQGTHPVLCPGALHLWERKVPRQQAPSAQNTLRQTCRLSRERGKCQRTENRQQKSGQGKSLPGSSLQAGWPQSKECKEGSTPREVHLYTQFKEEIRVMDDTNLRSLVVCSPRTQESPSQQLPTGAVPQPLQFLSSHERNWQPRQLLLSFNFSK